MSNKTFNEINNLSFSELKQELYKCHNNPLKEKLIREIMYAKYNKHVNDQQLNKQRVDTKMRNNIRKTEPVKIPGSDPSWKISEIFTNDSSSEEDAVNYNDRFFDQPYIEYKKDITNNNLMDRLNADMEIKKIKMTSHKKNIIKPFVNESCDTYATFGNEPLTNIKSFRNK